MKLRVIVITAFLLASLSPADSATPPKSGTNCAKSGITMNYQGKKYTCIKSGKKLVWDKGVQNKVAASLPNSQPTASPTPTPIAVDSLNFKNLMIYGVKESKLIRRADSGLFYESDSRKDSSFSEIRQRAFRALNENM